MKNIGFTLLTVIMIIGLGAAGYFGIKSLSTPSDYLTDDTEKIGDLYEVTTDSETGVTADPTPEAPAVVQTQPETETEDDVLASNLQKLLDAKTVLKLGSRGSAVGYVQEFMNRYFDKNIDVDNDFGKILETNVKAFQKATGLPQTGQVGTQGLTKMTAWLAKQ